MSGLSTGGAVPSPATLSSMLQSLTDPAALKASIAKLKAAEDAANAAAQRADHAKQELAAYERELRVKNDDLQKRIAEHEQKARAADNQQAQQSITLDNRSSGLAVAQQALSSREAKLRDATTLAQQHIAERERALDARAAQLEEREAIVARREQIIAKIKQAVTTALGG